MLRPYQINQIRGFETDAGKFIGVTFYATNPISVYSSPGTATPIKTIPAGGLIGIVWSYVTQNGALWWMFRASNGTYFYVKHTPGAFVETEEIKKLISAQTAADAAAAEQAAIQQKGAFVYYFEKYGKVLLFTVGGLILATQIIKKTNFGRK